MPTWGSVKYYPVGSLAMCVQWRSGWWMERCQVLVLYSPRKWMVVVTVSARFLCRLAALMSTAVAACLWLATTNAQIGCCPMLQHLHPWRRKLHWAEYMYSYRLSSTNFHAETGRLLSHHQCTGRGPGEDGQDVCMHNVWTHLAQHYDCYACI